jgi:hypothetical protein
VQAHPAHTTCAADMRDWNSLSGHASYIKIKCLKVLTKQERTDISIAFSSIIHTSLALITEHKHKPCDKSNHITDINHT